MTATKTTLSGRTADPQIKPFGALDESGAGAGPFHMTKALVDSAGALVNPARDETLSTIHDKLSTTLSTAVTNFPATQAATQSGAWSVTANAGTNLNTSALALESGGNLAAVASAAGAASDAAYAGSGSASMIAALKGLFAKLAGTLTVAWSGSPNVTVANASVAITAASLPLPSGAATAANQPALNGDGGALAHVTNFPATQPATQSGTWTVQPGNTPNATPWLTRPSDGTNSAAIKAATIAAVAADPALVVALSPNSPTPAGSNVIGQMLPKEDAAQAGAATGTITAAGQSVVVPVAGYSNVTMVVTGTFSGITSSSFQISYDGGTSYQTFPIAQQLNALGGAFAGQFDLATNAVYGIYVGGATHLKYFAPLYTSGTANLKFIPTAMPAVNFTGNTGGVNGTALTGGLSSALVSRLASAAATTNATSVKATPGRVYKITGYNAAGSVRYLKLYNKASAPTVGTDTPFWTEALAPNAKFDLNWADIGLYCFNGVAYALTTGPTDGDTGALTAGDILGLNVGYR